MKVQITEPQILDIKFPCIMQSANANDLIVLFVDWEEGLILKSDNDKYQTNTMNLAFSMEDFSPFVGSITLSNF